MSTTVRPARHIDLQPNQRRRVHEPAELRLTQSEAGDQTDATTTPVTIVELSPGAAALCLSGQLHVTPGQALELVVDDTTHPARLASTRPGVGSTIVCDIELRS